MLPNFRAILPPQVLRCPFPFILYRYCSRIAQDDLVLLPRQACVRDKNSCAANRQQPCKSLAIRRTKSVHELPPNTSG
jgi:hypothetical protein